MQSVSWSVGRSVFSQLASLPVGRSVTCITLSLSMFQDVREFDITSVFHQFILIPIIGSSRIYPSVMLSRRGQAVLANETFELRNQQIRIEINEKPHR